MTSAKSSHSGIPGKLTLEFVQSWVQPRVSEKRYRHIAGVAACAKRLALATNGPTYKAELAAWLHDCCKEMKSSQLLSQAELRGIRLQEADRQSPHLLHGPVAALLVREEFGLTDQDVLDAISQHTLGQLAMTKLAQIVFLADCLEPGRPTTYTDPIWQALQIDTKPDLDAAMLTACNLNLQHLLDSGKPVHPLTVEVRNYYLELQQKMTSRP